MIFEIMVLVQTIGDAQEVPGRPKMDVNLLCCSGIGMAQDGADKLYRDTFCVEGRGEIMPQSMRPEPWYPGLACKFFTEAVHAVSCMIAL